MPRRKILLFDDFCGQTSRGRMGNAGAMLIADDDRNLRIQMGLINRLGKLDHIAASARNQDCQPHIAGNGRAAQSI